MFLLYQLFWLKQTAIMAKVILETVDFLKREEQKPNKQNIVELHTAAARLSARKLAIKNHYF